MTGPFGEHLPNQITQPPNTLTPTQTPLNTTPGTTYNYVGQHQKMTDLESSAIIGGITQMGARVYLPILGRFLQVDPVEGGTDNSYVYANDPVNEFDLDGKAIPVFFLLGSVARMAAPHIARAAVRYVAKPAAKFIAKRAVPLLKKGAGHVARWGVNRWKSIPRVNVQIKKSGPNHWWPHSRGVKGRGWYKHIEINIRVINRSTNRTTKFIHKQIKYGRAYKYKHGRYGARL